LFLLIVGAGVFSSSTCVESGTSGYAYVPLERSYHHWGGRPRIFVICARPSSPQAGETGANKFTASENQQLKPWRAQGRLDRSDRLAALQALELALSELGDGVTLVWQRPERALWPGDQPVSAFRDDLGRICRHVVYSLALGGFQQAEIEGVACREATAPGRFAG
jgi:surface antigen